jgi:hypothetical protein
MIGATSRVKVTGRAAWPSEVAAPVIDVPARTATANASDARLTITSGLKRLNRSARRSKDQNLVSGGRLDRRRVTIQDNSAFAIEWTGF